MNLRASALALTFSALLAHTPGTASAAPGPDFRYSRALTAPSKVEIRGLSGRIHAEPAAGNTVEIEAVKQVRRGDPNQVRVVAYGYPGGVVVCELYPGQDENGCRPGQSLTDRHRDNALDVVTDFTVRLPAGASFDAWSVSGEVEAVRLAADVHANTVSGSIRVTTTANASAKSVSGTIDVTMGAPATATSFDSVSGSIDLRLPAASNADVDINTVSGPIRSDFFPVTRGWPLPGPAHASPPQLRSR